MLKCVCCFAEVQADWPSCRRCGAELQPVYLAKYSLIIGEPYYTRGGVVDESGQLYFSSRHGREIGHQAAVGPEVGERPGGRHIRGGGWPGMRDSGPHVPSIADFGQSGRHAEKQENETWCAEGDRQQGPDGKENHSPAEHREGAERDAGHQSIRSGQAGWRIGRDGLSRPGSVGHTAPIGKRDLFNLRRIK